MYKDNDARCRLGCWCGREKGKGEYQDAPVEVDEDADEAADMDADFDEDDYEVDDDVDCNQSSIQ